MLKSCLESSRVPDEVILKLSASKVVPVCHSRMLVLHGIPKHLKTDYVRKVIQRTLDKVGGIFMSELFVPSIESNSKAAISVGQNNSGSAVVEVRAQKKIDEAKLALEVAEDFHQVIIL